MRHGRHKKALLIAGCLQSRGRRAYALASGDD